MPRYKTKYNPTPKKKNLTPLWLALSGVGLLLIAVWAILSGGNRTNQAVEVSGSARLKVDQNLLDYGDQRLGNTVRAEVKVTNVGDQTLRFTEDPYIEVVEGC